MIVNVKIKKLEANAVIPERASEKASGYDLRACIQNDETIEILPRERKLIPTGLAIELPDGYEGQIRPRSGLALNNGITVLNAPGTIDSDYNGPIGVILINLGSVPFFIRNNDRIAQLVVQETVHTSFTEVDKLTKTNRGAGGFGSTGIK